LPIEVPDLLLPQNALQGGQGRGFAAALRFAYLAHIAYVDVDEIASAVVRRETDVLAGANR